MLPVEHLSMFLCDFVAFFKQLKKQRLRATPAI